MPDPQLQVELHVVAVSSIFDSSPEGFFYMERVRRDALASPDGLTIQPGSAKSLAAQLLYQEEFAILYGRMPTRQELAEAFGEDHMQPRAEPEMFFYDERYGEA